MIELLLAHVVVVSLFTGAAAALCVRPAMRLWRRLSEVEDREGFFLASSTVLAAGAFLVANSAAAATGNGGPSVGGACGQPVVGADEVGQGVLVFAVHGLSSRTVHTAPQARSTVAPAPYSPFEAYRDSDGFLAIEDMAPCDQAAFYEDVEVCGRCCGRVSSAGLCFCTDSGVVSA